MDCCVPSVWNASWNGLLADSSAAGAVSAIYRAISAASACAARGRPSCKRQVSGSNPLTGSQRSSSLKERAGVKGGFGLQFCGGMAFAGHGGMALWLAFPDRCRVRASGLAGQGPGGARPRSGATGVLDALVREPIMAGAGKGRGRVHGLCGYGRPIAGCPAGRPAGCLHPFGCAPAWRAGGHGAGSRPGTGGANHISVPAAAPAGAGCGGEHKTSRPRARPGRQLTLPGWWRGGCARRACRRTPGSA